MRQNKMEWDNWRSRKQEEGNKEHGRKEVREGEMEGRKEREKKAYRHGSIKNTERFPKRAPKVQASGWSEGKLPQERFWIFNFHF